MTGDASDWFLAGIGALVAAIALSTNPLQAPQVFAFTVLGPSGRGALSGRAMTKAAFRDGARVE